MRRFKFKKPFVESPYPPKSKNVLWVDVNESTGKISTIRQFKKGQWIDYMQFVPEPEIPEPIVGPADNEIWYTTEEGEAINWYYEDGIWPEHTVNDNTTFGGGNLMSNTYENGIGKLVFEKPLTQITSEPGSMFSYFSSIQSGKKITKIVLPNTMSSIGYYAFMGCGELTDITIPESITQIQGNAFYGCVNLESINIPKTIEEISPDAFEGCQNTPIINYNGTVGEWNSKNITLYYPENGIVHCTDGDITIPATN